MTFALQRFSIYEVNPGYTVNLSTNKLQRMLLQNKQSRYISKLSDLQNNTEQIDIQIDVTKDSLFYTHTNTMHDIACLNQKNLLHYILKRKYQMKPR
jgi:c-di-GMP-binding flagellar brake protein YcgR